MLKDLALDDIEQLKNYRDTEPISENDPDMVELAANIKKDNVLQPILVRPKKGTVGKYQLIFGHRRHLGARMAGLAVIPCNIKDVEDEDVLELQVTENLQRKDVHPMDEAIAFRSLMKDKGYSIEGIANRFAKRPDYIALRLKLNDLIPDLQGRFKKNSITLGHALELCRLRPDDQKEAAKSSWNMETVSSLRDFIGRNIIRQLSSAPFKRDDETLHPNAGPCTTCKKRSGCNQLLFADIKEDDRCFDKGCFQTKLDTFFVRQLKDVIETKPNIHLVQMTTDKLPKEVSTLIRQMNVTVLSTDQYQRYGGYGKFKQKTKALFLDGYSRGKIEDIYVQGAAKKEAKDGKLVKRTLTAVKDEIDALASRQKRALELDAEKVWKQISDDLEHLDNLSSVPWEKTPTQEELNAMAGALLMGLSESDYDSTGAEVLGFSEFFYLDNPEAERLTSVTLKQVYHLLRLFTLFELNRGLSPKSAPGPLLLMPILRSSSYLKERVEAVEAAQKEEADGRITRSDKRMKALLEEKKELEGKVKPKAEKPASENGKSKKRGLKASPGKTILHLIQDPEENGDDE